MKYSSHAYSIIKSGTQIFSVGNQDLSCISILHPSLHRSRILLLATLLVHPTFFSCCFPCIPSIISWRLCILFMSDLFMLFDFFAVQEIRSILHRNHISVASSFFCNCFEIALASHPYIIMGSILHSRAPLFVLMEMFLFVSIYFIF